PPECVPFFEPTTSESSDDQQRLTPTTLDALAKQIHAAALTEVTLIHRNLRWYLENALQGTALLLMDEKQPHLTCYLPESLKMHRYLKDIRKTRPKGEAKLLPSDREQRFVKMAYRLQWLLNGSLYEHMLLMPNVMREDADPGLLDDENEIELTSTLNPSQLGEKIVQEVKKIVIGATSIAPGDGSEVSPKVPQRTYFPYDEHLKLAWSLPGLENTDEQELFPREWLKEFSMNGKWARDR
ncbi:hypothetical protein B0T20DRAFT_103895, partial [Sordaria brevicollis]